MGSKILSTPEFSSILSKSINDVELRGLKLRRINEEKEKVGVAPYLWSWDLSAAWSFPSTVVSTGVFPLFLIRNTTSQLQQKGRSV